MTFPVEVYQRQVDSWDERCPHRVSIFRDEERGGFTSKRKRYSPGEDDNVQLLADGRWIAENLTGLWSSHCTGTTNIFCFQDLEQAIMFKLYAS